jgi:hypothetical protein
MADPVTVTVLGGWAAAEGIKFLYGQASELLKARRERARDAKLHVPIIANNVLVGTPGDVADGAVIDREGKSLGKLSGLLSPYALGHLDIDPTDPELAEQAIRLRGLLEAVYGQRFTFHDEDREPTGTAVTVTQVLGEVDGDVMGMWATVGHGANAAVTQITGDVNKDASVTGFKGNIGRS